MKTAVRTHTKAALAALQGVIIFRKAAYQLHFDSFIRLSMLTDS